MALKEKILDRAQKYTQKGYFEKAIAEYKAAAELDPKDISIRLRVGDLYVKINRKADAIKEYTEAAKANNQRGFYLKAIAVYKQVLKLDETSLEVHYKLAELYTKQRLIADAISEYSFIVSAFEKNGKTSDVMELLKKMVDIDPENVGVRLKLADLYQRLSFEKDALAEYSLICDKLLAQGKIDKAEKIYLGLYNTHPKEPAVLKGLAELYQEKGDHSQAIRFAKPLFHVYRELEKTEDAKAVCEAILAFSDDAESLSFLRQFKEKSAEEEDMKVLEERASLIKYPEKEIEEPEKKAETGHEERVTEIPSGPPLPEEEIEITLEGFEEAEAKVRQEESGVELKAAVTEAEKEETAPVHAAEAKAEEAEVEVDIPLEASEEAEKEIELEITEAPVAPALEVEVSAEAPKAEMPLEASEEAEKEIELEITEAPVASAPEVEVSAEAPKAEMPLEAAKEAEKEIEFEIKEEPESALPAEVTAVEAEAGEEKTPVSGAEEARASEPAGESFEIEEAALKEEPLISIPEAGEFDKEEPVAEEEAPEGGLEFEVTRPIEELPGKETEFEMKEAHGAAASEEPGTGPKIEFELTGPGKELPHEETGFELKEDKEDTPASVEEMPMGIEEESLEAAIEEVNLKIQEEIQEAESKEGPAIEEGVEQRASEGVFDDSIKAPEEDIISREVVEGVEEDINVPVSREASEPQVPVEEGAASEDISRAVTELMDKIEPEDMLLENERVRQESEGGEEYVDLSAELGMQGAVEDKAGSWGAAESKETLDEFKNGIGQQLSKEDAETHYNLGIAYMEMELYNEAAKEFKIALKDPHLEFDCYIRLGFCSMGESNPHEAIVYYLKGLRIEGRSDSERMGMMYELALAYEKAGEDDEAQNLFKSIYSIDPDYREVSFKVGDFVMEAPLIPLDDGLIEVELL